MMQQHADSLETAAPARCPVCAHARNARTLFVRGDQHLRACLCGARFLDPMPRGDLLQSVYENADYFASEDRTIGYTDYLSEEDNIRRTARMRLRLILRERPPPGRLLEIGAAFGCFVDEARRSGYHTTAIELSPAAEEKLRERSDEHYIGRLEDTEFSGPYDVVALFDTLEHLPEPRALVERLEEIMRPGAILALTTPHAGGTMARLMGRRWFSYRFPEHVVLYDEKAIRRLLSESFQILRVHSDAQWIGSGTLLGRLGLRSKKTRGRTIRVPNGNMYVVARRL